MRLRDGSEVQDPRLDRLQQFDPRSRSYPIMALAPEGVRGTTWACGHWLNQHQEGACVGFSIAHDLGAVPIKVPVSEALAHRLYRRGQDLDPWPETRPGGEGGTSILAGLQAAREFGLIEEFRWAFGVDQTQRGLMKAPAIAGLPWKDSMFTPNPDGLLDCSGSTVGSHAIMIRGQLFKWRPRGSLRPLEVFKLRNSWGIDWGQNGDCYILMEDMARLLQEGGEVAFTIGQRRTNGT